MKFQKKRTKQIQEVEKNDNDASTCSRLLLTIPTKGPLHKLYTFTKPFVLVELCGKSSLSTQTR